MDNNENQNLNNTKNEDEFIQEKIVNRRRKNLMKKLLTVVFVLILGLVFGFAARMAMLFTDSRLEGLLGGLDKTPTPLETQIPSDIPATDTPVPSDPVISSVPVTLSPTPADVAELSPVPTLFPIEGEIEIPVLNPEAPHTEFSYSGFYAEVAALAEAVRPQIADITAVMTYIDWFGDKSYVNVKSSGLVIGNNGLSLLILTDYASVEDSDSISVSVLGKKAEASVYAYDDEFGLAVIAVDLSVFTEEERENIRYAKLYPEEYIKTGNSVVAVGYANGYADSIAFGMISGSGYKTYVTDGEVRYFTTDWTDHTDSSAFIYDMSGAVCGMVTHTFKQNSDDGITTCISLENLKDVITALINGRTILYTGISCGELSESVQEASGLNFGIYIRDVKNDSPAAAVGLRTGDIIVAVNEIRVQSASDLTMYLSGISEGETLTIDYRRVTDEGITDERVIVTPVSR